MMLNLKTHASEKYRRLQTIIFKTLITLRRKKIIVITGCGRSGTTFSSKLLRKCGLIIGHERLYINGISSWRLVSDLKKVQLGPSYSDLEDLDKVVIHQVREPLAAISSMLAIGSPSWKLIAQEIPVDLESDSKILRAMKYYYYWNMKAELKSEYRIKVETFKYDIKPILVENGIKFIDKLGDIGSGNNINTRRHDLLDWENLDKEDGGLSAKIKELGIKYGYLNIR